MNEHVDMIGHDEEQVEEPVPIDMIEPRRIKQERRIVNKRCRAPLLRRNGDEIDGPDEINREWAAMINRFPRR